MTAEIDMSNERANIAFVGKVPWHGLGQKLTPDATLDDWRREAGLDWEVIKTPVLFQQDNNIVEMPDRHVLHRSDTEEAFSVVSERYNPVQPEEIMGFFKSLVEVYGAFRMEVAGSLAGGRKIWALAKSNEEFNFADDRIQQYLLLSTSFDKSAATGITPTTVRVVCQNTLQTAIGSRGQKAMYKVNHVADFKKRAEEIKNALKIDDQWLLFGDAVENLASKAVTISEAKKFFKDLYYTDEMLESEVFSVKAADRKVATLMDHYRNAPGQELITAKDTAWGLVNAVSHYYDHGTRARTNDARLNRAWFGPGATYKNRAMENALALV